MRFFEDLDSFVANHSQARQLRVGMSAGNPLLDHMPMGYLGVRPVVQAAKAAVQLAVRNANTWRKFL